MLVHRNYRTLRVMLKSLDRHEAELMNELSKQEEVRMFHA